MLQFSQVKVQRTGAGKKNSVRRESTPIKATVKNRSPKPKSDYEIDYFGSTSRAKKNSPRRRTEEPALFSRAPAKFQVPTARSPQKVYKDLAATLDQIEDHPLPGTFLSQTIEQYSLALQLFELTDKTGDQPVLQLGRIKRNGNVVPVYAVCCRKPEQVEQYTTAISGLNGLVIAVNADAMAIPDSSLCFAHKEKRKLGNKGQAEKLRKWGGKRFLKAAKAALTKGGTGDLAPSEVVAVKLDDNNRGRLQGNAVLLINGPRVPKGQKTNAQHIAGLRHAFDNAVEAASQIESGSVTFTGISTGRFNFNPALGGQIAMESMVDALAEGKIKRAVGAFWCKPDGSFEGSTAEGAVATLFAHPDFEAVG